MATKRVIEGGLQMSRYVKPIKSANAEEARRNVLAIYKKGMKQLPVMLYQYEGLSSRTEYEFKLAFKRLFLKNANVRDLRVIDRLVSEVDLELKEIYFLITPSYTIMNRLFHENIEHKPTDFLSKFFSGKN